MKIDWAGMGWEATSWTDAEWREAYRWENLPEAQRAGLTIEAWDQWIMASCVEWNHGHRWWLDWDADDGLDLHCQHCCAGVDQLYPDGNDLIYAELPLPADKVLKIENGMLPLDADAPVQEGHGPVKAEVWSSKYYSWEYGAWEYDAGIIVEAA